MREVFYTGSIEEIRLHLKRIEEILGTAIVETDEYPRKWGLSTRYEMGWGDAKTTPLLRTPDLGEGKIIHLALRKNSFVIEMPIPKYRYNDVPNYETEANRRELQRDFAFLIYQSVFLTNNNSKMLPDDFDPQGSPWQGCYAERKYLIALDGTINLSVSNEKGVNIRSGAGTGFEVLRGTVPSGSLLVSDKMVDVVDEKWVHIVSIDGEPIDGWMAYFWSNRFLLEIVPHL